MAEFEQLKLSVDLADNASSGLVSIRNQITQLTASTGQLTTSLGAASKELEKVGGASVKVAPQVKTVDEEIKKLRRSSEEATRGLMQMGLASLRGMGGLSQLVLGLREAQQGVLGMGESMTNLMPTARFATIALGSLAVGVVAVGASVSAYFISVFKFAKEMKELSSTAKMLGVSLGELKNAQDQAKVFGVSAEIIVQSFASIQKAQVDLYQSGSPLRRRLLAIGTPAETINEIMRADPARAQNLAVEYARQIERGFIKEGASKSVARGFANKFLEEWGLSGRLLDMPPLRMMTEDEKKKWDQIEQSSKKISEVWGSINEKLDRIKVAVLIPGLPWVLRGLRLADEYLKSIVETIEGPMGGALIGGAFGTLIGAISGAIVGGPLGAVVGAAAGGVGGAYLGSPATPAVPSPPPPMIPGLSDAIPQSYRPSSEGGNPLLHRMNFTTEELSEDTKDNTDKTEKLTEQLAKLNAYFDRVNSGAAPSGGGGNPPGVTTASYGPPGTSGAGVPGTGNAAAAGNAGIPSGGTGAGTGDGTQPDTGDTSKVGSEFLASQRARLKQELDEDPELKKRFAALIQMENGPAGVQVAEATMNRAIMTGRTMRSILSGGPKSFFGPARTPGRVEGFMGRMSAKDLAERNRQIEQAYSSNLTKGATDQGSKGAGYVDPNYYSGGQAVPDVHGERFNYYGGYKGVPYSKEWARRQQEQVNQSAAVAAARKPTSYRDLESLDFASRSLRRSAMPDTSTLDRGPIDRENSRTSTSKGKLKIDINGGAGAQNKSTDPVPHNMRTQIQNMPTVGGPMADDTLLY